MKVDAADDARGTRAPGHGLEPDTFLPVSAAHAPPVPPAPGAQSELTVSGGGASADEFATELGPGQPLDAHARTRMGDAFGHDFGHVRIHTGEPAQRKAAELGAAAFTVGSDVGFAAGRYAPGAPDGDTLLAHELAHVVQQEGAATDPVAGHKPIGGEGAAAEADADAAAYAAVIRMHSGDKSAGIANASLRTGYQVQRSPETAANRIGSAKFQGAWEGKTVATQRWLTIGIIPIDRTVKIRAGRMLGEPQATEAAAIALVRTNGQAGVVTAEKGLFVAYATDAGFTLSGNIVDPLTGGGDFIDPPEVVPGVLALVPNEGVIMRPGAGKQTATTDKQMTQTGDPLRGYKDALAGGKGLDTLDDARMLQAFVPAMKDTAFAVLAQAENEVKQAQKKFGNHGAGVVAEERSLVHDTALELLAVQKLLDAADQDKQAAFALMRASGKMAMKFLERANATYERYRPQRNAIRAKYPMLARFTTAQLEAFTKQDKQQQVEALGAQFPGILQDIATTRDNLVNDKIDLWESREIVEATTAGLGINDTTKRAAIENSRKAHERNNTLTTIVKTVLTIGLGLGGALLGGPVGAAMAAGALGLDLADAVHETDQYFVKQAATNTNVDPARSILDPSQAPGWGWLIVSWGAVVLDVADVKAAVKAIEAGEKSVGKAAGDLAKAHAGEKGLKESDLAAKLREAAGELQAEEKITLANKDGLGCRLGISIEIDKTAGETGVKIDTRINAETGKVEIVGMRVGPSATLADILGHQEVIKLLRRYEGLTGKVRELWDKLQSFATGKVNPNLNPFEPNSQAWFSWYEVKKLPGLIEQRYRRLGTSITKEQEALLRQDVDFLEHELERHQELVDRMATERGPGHIALPDNPTSKLCDGTQGYELPDLQKQGKKPPYSTDDMTSSAYYYRIEGNKPPILQRKAGQAGEGTLVPEVVHGKPTGKFLPGELTREEKSAAIVHAFPHAKQDAFRELVDRTAKTDPLATVVPVEGIASTNTTIRKLCQQSGNVDFEKDLTKLLLRALEKRIARKELTKAEARTMVDVAVKNLMDHEITVIRGTDQLRAYNYRLRFKTATGVLVEDDLHHIVPLYLGGDHLPGEAKKLGNLIDLPAGEGGVHGQIHDLVDGVKYNDKGVMLAPSSIQNAAGLNFQHGAAILHADGTIEFNTLGATPP